MADAFDLVVIGSGTAARAASAKARKAKWRVAMVDEAPLGGTCALRGCDPKKMLIEGAEVVGRRAPHICTRIKTEKDAVLGAHLVGPGADEVINLFALAIRHGLTRTQLRDTLFAYPTAGSDLGSML